MNTTTLDTEELLRGDERIIAEAQRRFKQCQAWEGVSRNRSIQDLKFANGDSYNNYQWEDLVRANREIDKRPCLTINKTKQHNFLIINEALQNKATVKYRPTGNGATFEAAQIFQGIVRNIEYQSNADDARSTAIKSQVEAGIGYLRVATDYAGNDSFDQEIFIRRVKDFTTIYLDPDINEKDGSDASFGFVFEDMPIDQFRKAYPKYKDKAGRTALNNGDGWITKDHVRIAEYFYKTKKKDRLVSMTDPKTGDKVIKRLSHVPEVLRQTVIDDPQTKMRTIEEDVVEHCLIIGDEVAEKKVWPGIYIPIVRFVGEETIIDNTLDRKGHTRSLIDVQRNYNWYASCQIEMVSLQSKSPYMAPVAAIEGLETYYADANRKNYAVLPYNHVDDKGQEIPMPKRQSPPVMSPGYAQGLQESAAEFLMVSGQYEASFGQKSNETSGKAINARQRQGDIATYHYIDNQAVAIRFLGKILLDLIPKIYDTPRIIRILGEDGVESHVHLDPKAKEAYQAQKAEEDMQQREQVSVIFNPNVGKYDVESDIGPDYATKRQEAYNALSMMMQNNPETAMMVGDLWADNSDFPEAPKIAQRFRNMLPPQAKGEGPSAAEQQLQQQVQQSQAVIAKLMQQLAEQRLKDKDYAAQKEIDIYEAETRRMDVEGKIVDKHSITPKVKAEMLHDLAMQEHSGNLALVNAAMNHDLSQLSASQGE